MRSRWRRTSEARPSDDELDGSARRAVVDAVVADAPLRDVLVTIAEHIAERLSPCYVSFHGPVLRSGEVGAGTSSTRGARASVTETFRSGPLALSLGVWLPASTDRGPTGRPLALAGDLARIALVAEEARRSREVRPDTDPVTGAMNRPGALAYLSGASAAGVPGPHAVIAIDLDGLRRVTDRYGPGATDAVVLVGAAERVRAVAGPTDLVARTGGDEFALLCLALGEPGTADERAEALRVALAEPYRFGDRSEVCTATVGVAVSDDAPDLPALLPRAWAAVTAGKAAGRNRVVRWDVTMSPG